MHTLCSHIKEKSDIKEATSPYISILCLQIFLSKYFCDSCVIKVTAPLLEDN